MTDHMLPIIRQMIDAPDDRARAGVLLAVPDTVLMKHREQFEAVCRRAGFDLGQHFIDIRRASWHAVRGPDGRHVNPLFEDARAALAEFAAHGAGDASAHQAARPSEGPAGGQPPAGGDPAREAQR